MKGNCYNPYAARGIAVSCFFNCQRRDIILFKLFLDNFNIFISTFKDIFKNYILISMNIQSNGIKVSILLTEQSVQAHLNSPAPHA